MKTKNSSLCTPQVRFPSPTPRSERNIVKCVRFLYVYRHIWGNGDTTKRSDIFKDYKLSVSKDKRLSGTWTLEQYEGHCVVIIDSR